jgi:hypothetical protein
LTEFQPMCGKVGASTSSTVRPASRPKVSTPPSSLASNRTWKPQANAETRPAGTNPIAQRLDQTAFPEMLHGRAGRADTGHDDRVHAGQIPAAFSATLTSAPTAARALVMLTMFAAP